MIVLTIFFNSRRVEKSETTLPQPAQIDSTQPIKVAVPLPSPESNDFQLPTGFAAATPLELQPKVNEANLRELRPVVSSDDTPNIPAVASTNAAIELPGAWTNTLGMRFLLVAPPNALFSVRHTRVSDYEAFANASRRNWAKPGFPQTAADPAVNVSWHDATAFCDWLTKLEHNNESLPNYLVYRLPTEVEWITASCGNNGLRSSNSTFAWGEAWPPPWGSGNYAQSLHADGYVNTSPVGSFTPNNFGLFDTVGNVMQWCDYAKLVVPGDAYRPITGASWKDFEPRFLICERLSHFPMHQMMPLLGFRLVLVWNREN